MKKMKVVSLFLIVFFSFFTFLDGVKASTSVPCNIGYENDNGGYGYYTSFESMALSELTKSMISSGRETSGNCDGDWCDEVDLTISLDTTIQVASEDDLQRITWYNITFYDKNNKYLCEIDPNVGGVSAVKKWGYSMVFSIKLLRGEVSYANVSFLYERYNNTDGGVGPERVDVFKRENGKSVDNTKSSSKTSSAKTLKPLETETNPDPGHAGKAKLNASDVTYDPSNGRYKKCEDLSVKDLIDEYWSYVMICVPIALILLISIDFFKALVSNNQDQLKKSSNDAMKRTLAAVILLMLPALLSMILGWVGLELCI